MTGERCRRAIASFDAALRPSWPSKKKKRGLVPARRLSIVQGECSERFHNGEPALSQLAVKERASSHLRAADGERVPRAPISLHRGRRPSAARAATSPRGSPRRAPVDSSRPQMSDCVSSAAGDRRCRLVHPYVQLPLVSGLGSPSAQVQDRSIGIRQPTSLVGHDDAWTVAPENSGLSSG